MNAITKTFNADFSLQDRYTRESGAIYLNGIQALVRILLDQRRADVRAGLNTGGFVCGYPGSPVGGVDDEMEKNAAILTEHHVVHRRGLNEELAATAVFGTQALHGVPKARYDGVYGLWFGKAPGVDRSIDAFRHANFRGVGKNGGVLAVAGDDPHARSTIFPSDSNGVFSSLYMPTLCPGNVQDVIDFGLHGYALSRAAGLWVGFKLVTDVADSAGTALIDPARIAPVIPEVLFDGQPLVPRLRVNEAGGLLIEAERRIVYGQHEIARQYARLNGLNRITFEPKRPRIGLMTVGKTYYDLRQALRDLGFDDAMLEAAGVRILKMGMIYPVEPQIIRDFARGLEEIVVIEDKRPTLETAVKELLYDSPDRPRVVGRADETGAPLLTAHGELSADLIARALAKRLRGAVPSPARLDERIDLLDRNRNTAGPPAAARTPYFCSGCPHNRSLRVPEGSVVGAGIGCHIMTLWMGPVFGDVVGFTQMGGEGAQWVGLAPFSDTGHFFQNLGDGTFAHSGSLAVRFAVSAGINVTYKLLYNSTIAMTGGQDVPGSMTVPDMVRMLTAEGVRRIVITTDEPEKYAGVDVAGAAVRHRDDLVEAERELAATPGVTVLINDQQCAAEKRRKRKRGALAYKRQSVMINERVCEGCGDCGAKSNCLSVQPVATEFGRKTQIHQSSCNQDFSCLLGDCPSFMTVETTASKAEPRKIVAAALPEDLVLPDPRPLVPADGFSAGLVGIGGTGVVTVNQILGTAANIAGLHAQTYDHTGSSQKAGPVISHLKVSRGPIDGAPTVSSGSADLYLVFDPLGAVNPNNIVMASPQRTVAVVSTTRVPTGEMVSNPGKAYPSMSRLTDRINAASRPDHNIFFDAQDLAERLLGDHMACNLLLVGAAYQRGALPIPAEAIEQAIRLNATAVPMNLAAFRWGRLSVADPARVAAAARREAASAGAAPAEKARAVVSLAAARIVDGVGADGELKRLLGVRVPELIAFQSEAYARDYAAVVREALAAEARAGGGRRGLSESVARNLYKLMAYKDEYEVARLMLAEEAQARLTNAFGSEARVSWHLHPTFLRALGVKKKVKLGPWFKPAFRLLKAMKSLRGTPLDLLGRTQVRRVERALIGHYRALLAATFAKLDSATYDLAVELAEIPDLVRGYEHVKLGNVARYKAAAERLAGLLGLNVPFGPVLGAIAHEVAAKPELAKAA
ncbi:indolepyruvate ferredoxin oxidoreductase family protein [Chelatococcus reniformis]|nr:indolepyruvate ferredoxin oxidoreductase family protein [Chelatococcus reniformis]